MPKHSLRIQLLAIAALCCAAGSAEAESRLTLPYPDIFGEVEASTFSTSGARIGSSRIDIRVTPHNTVVMDILTTGAGKASNAAWAELAVIESRRHGKLLRLLRERSESHDAKGNSLGLMWIDHVKGQGRCGPPSADGEETVDFELPVDDRITNVPLNLLFLPLVQAKVDQIDFQLFLCRGGPRVVDFAATIKGNRPPANSDFRIVEVQYKPELNAFLSMLASSFIPNLSFWFDANGNGTYLAHRMPLFTKGPEVMIVRDGIEPSLLESRP